MIPILLTSHILSYLSIKYYIKLPIPKPPVVKTSKLKKVKYKKIVLNNTNAMIIKKLKLKKIIHPIVFFPQLITDPLPIALYTLFLRFPIS